MTPRAPLERLRPIALLPAELTGGIDEAACQDRAQPRPQLEIGLATKLVESLMGLQERLLDDVGGVELPAQPGIELQLSQQPQILAVVLQRTRVTRGAFVHRAAYLRRRTSRKKLTPRSQIYVTGDAPEQQDGSLTTDHALVLVRFPRSCMSDSTMSGI